MEDPRDGGSKPKGKKCQGWHFEASVGDRSGVAMGHMAPVEAVTQILEFGL